MDEIELQPYDAAWPEAYIVERNRVRPAFDGLGETGFEHFGSTAIPGLAAKPIIDILAIVPDVDFARSKLPLRLDQLGYDFWADNPKTDRLFFVRGMPPRGAGRTHHIHVCEPDSEMWRQLAFRDYLRAHPEAVAEYEDLKQKLAQAHRTDREAYTSGKQAFIERIMQQAISSERS